VVSVVAPICQTADCCNLIARRMRTVTNKTALACPVDAWLETPPEREVHWNSILRPDRFTSSRAAFFVDEQSWEDPPGIALSYRARCSEADLEAVIKKVQGGLFGPGCVYLDVKKKIGTQRGLRNIPDGYLIDLTGDAPRLFVVEVELASHDPLRHIAVQIQSHVGRKGRRPHPKANPSPVARFVEPLRACNLIAPTVFGGSRRYDSSSSA
jgi:hypothetical protein